MRAGSILLLAIFVVATANLVAIENVFAQNDWARPIHSTVPPSSLYPARANSSSSNLFGILLSSLQENIESIEGIVAEEFGGPDLYEEFGESDIHYEDESPLVGVDAGREIYGAGCENCGEKLSGRCARCRRGRGLIVGGNGVYFLRPMWQNNPAFGVTTGASTIIGRDFDWDAVVTPHFWIGVQGSSGLGMRGRFMWFDGDSTINYLVPGGSTVVSPMIFGQQTAPFAAGTNVLARHQLKFHVTDIEFSYAKNQEAWGLEAAGGVRYTDFNQHYLIQDAGGVASLSSDHSFKGLGPTIFLKGQHALGGPLGVMAFASVRESILFGDGDGTVSNTQFRQELSKAFLSISEFEVGFRRVFWFRRISSEVELAFVGQLWSGVGNGANGALFTSQSDQSMGMLGGRASMGFSF